MSAAGTSLIKPLKCAHQSAAKTWPQCWLPAFPTVQPMEGNVCMFSRPSASCKLVLRAILYVVKFNIHVAGLATYTGCQQLLHSGSWSSICIECCFAAADQSDLKLLLTNAQHVRAAIRGRRAGVPAATLAVAASAQLFC